MPDSNMLYAYIWACRLAHETPQYFDKALTIKPDFALALKNKQKILELVK